MGNRGTGSGQDVIADLKQAAGIYEEQYVTAARNAQLLNKVLDNIVFTGHSLGGGLASVQALVTGRTAITFNAAGVHSDTLSRLKISQQQVDNANSLISAYHVDGEILNSVQNNPVLDVIAAVGFTLPRNIYEGIRGIFDSGYKPDFGIAYVPEALGEKITTPALDLSGKPFEPTFNPVTILKQSISLHTGDYVASSLQGYRGFLVNQIQE